MVILAIINGFSSRMMKCLNVLEWEMGKETFSFPTDFSSEMKICFLSQSGHQKVVSMWTVVYLLGTESN